VWGSGREYRNVCVPVVTQRKEIASSLLGSASLEHEDANGVGITDTKRMRQGIAEQRASAKNILKTLRITLLEENEPSVPIASIQGSGDAFFSSTCVWGRGIVEV